MNEPKQRPMEKKDWIVIAVIVLLFVSFWWFKGRDPYITMLSPYEFTLTYHEPKWYGWKLHPMRWINDKWRIMMDGGRWIPFEEEDDNYPDPRFYS